MNLNVNLMDSPEIQARKGFKKKHAFQGLGFLLLLGVVLFIGQHVLANLKEKSAIKALQNEIRLNEKKYNSLLTMREENNWAEKIKEELEQWKESSLVINPLAVELVGLVPENIQLLEMGLAGELVFRSAKVKGESDERLRTYSFSLAGRSEGENSEDAVLEFVKKLRAAENFGTVMESLRLSRTEREVRLNNNTTNRLFFIDGQYKERVW